VLLLPCRPPSIVSYVLFCTAVLEIKYACICMYVCMYDNSLTVRDIITKCSVHHPVVEGGKQVRKWLYCGVWVVRNSV